MSPALLFTNVNVFDGSGRPPFTGEVSVSDGRILAVAEASRPLERNTCEVVDGRGATLMPGLVEAHAHLSFPSSVGRIFNQMQLPPEEHLLVTAHNARTLLDSGFTSAYSAGSLGARFEIALKKEIDGGFLPGPRLIPSSIEKAPVNVLGLPNTQDQAHDAGANGIGSFIQKMAADGAQSIKLLLTSDEGFEPGGSQILLYSHEEAKAAGRAAAEAGVWLACHAQAAEAVKMAVRSGFRSIYHCTYADDEALDMLESRKNEIFVAPAPGLLYSRLYEAEEFGIDRATAERMGAAVGLELMQKIYPEMRKRGIRVLPGGDYGFPYNPIGRNARDLELFVSLFGYSAVETLVAATKLGGELMGHGDELGLVKPGYLADLLLVEGDPTIDIRILQDQSKLLMIMKGGAFHKRPPAHFLVH